MAYFIGCGTDLVFPEIATATVRVLYANRYRGAAARRWCDCGKPPMSYGDVEAAEHPGPDQHRRPATGWTWTPSSATAPPAAPSSRSTPSCSPRMTSCTRRRRRPWRPGCRTSSEFLAGIQFNDRMGEVKAKVTYHDPCHLVRFQKVSAQPRKLLKSIPGLEFKESVEADMCCGGAGSYFLTHYDLSQEVLARKMGNVGKTGADYLATGCPGCMMQLASGVRKHELPMQVIHTMQILDQAYPAAK